MHKQWRLKRRNDFKKVYTNGKSIANRTLVLYLRSNSDVDEYRFGISVSKKIGKAVVRNRVKRLIKEAIRSIIRKYSIKKNIDVVIIARKPVIDLEFAQVESSVEHLFRKMKLIDKKIEERK